MIDSYRVASLRLTRDTVLCPSVRHFILSLVLVQPRKLPDMTEKLLIGTKSMQENPILDLGIYGTTGLILR